MKVLETHIVHARDVIYWVDGTTASIEAAMERLSGPVALRLTTSPSDLRLLHGNGKTAFWRRADDCLVSGTAQEQDKALPPAAPFNLAGCVYDPEGRYHPRRFDISAGTGSGHRLVLYPSSLGSRFSKAGGLTGTLRWRGSETAVPWAILTLEVATALGASMVFRAQADEHGDFMLSVKRLPPLPEGIDHYDAQLTIAAPPAAATADPLDPADLSSATLGSLDSADAFSTSINLQVVFGEIRSVRSLNRKYLAVQPS